MQDLGDVLQVGQPALAVERAQQAGEQPLAGRDRLGQRRNAGVAQQRRPAVQPLVQSLQLIFARARQPLGIPAR